MGVLETFSRLYALLWGWRANRQALKRHGRY